MHVLTLATDPGRLKYLQQTAAMFQTPITYLMKSVWGGQADKITSVLNAIQDFSDDDIVCFIDAQDVLVNADIYELESKYKSQNTELLVSAELNCFPSEYRSQFPEGTKQFPNSGGQIGTVRAVRNMFQWKPLDEIVRICGRISQDGVLASDQAQVIEQVLAHGIPLEDRCEIFQCMTLMNWNDLVFQQGRVENSVLGTRPCFIHFNGGTFFTFNRSNIMPVFVQRMEESRTGILTLKDHKQL